MALANANAKARQNRKPPGENLRGKALCQPLAMLRNNLQVKLQMAEPTVKNKESDKVTGTPGRVSSGTTAVFPQPASLPLQSK